MRYELVVDAYLLMKSTQINSSDVCLNENQTLNLQIIPRIIVARWKGGIFISNSMYNHVSFVALSCICMVYQYQLRESIKLSIIYIYIYIYIYTDNEKWLIWIILFAGK